MKKIMTLTCCTSLLLAGAAAAQSSLPADMVGTKSSQAAKEEKKLPVAAAATQSGVTIYGIADMGFAAESGGASGKVRKLTSGIASGSRLGFKGTEVIGDGLSAFFLLEMGIGLDTGASQQGGLTFGRQSYVGLMGDFGSVSAGRQYTPFYLITLAVDPFLGGFGGNSTNLVPYTAASGRLENQIRYTSPKYSGIRIDLAYGFGETAGSNSPNSQYDGNITYEDGPLFLGVGYHHRNNNTSSLSSIESAKQTIFGATYNFGILKAHAGYGIDKGPNSSPLRNTTNPYRSVVAPTASTDSTDLVLGVSVPFGASTFLASYVQKNDKTVRNQDATQWGVGYMYAFSKRTDVYSGYAKINNKRGAGYTVGSVIETGSGDSAFQLGLRHRF